MELIDKTRVITDKKDLIALASDLLLKHNITASIKLTNAFHTIGCASWNYKTDKFILRLSQNWLNNSIEFWHNIILHEISHLLVYIRYGKNGARYIRHGIEFKNICIEIGCILPNATLKSEIEVIGFNNPIPKVKGYCKIHGLIATRYKLPKYSKLWHCKKCRIENNSISVISWQKDNT
jgi:predicted SprT family Zn-dependent metalloprotease